MEAGRGVHLVAAAGDQTKRASAAMREFPNIPAFVGFLAELAGEAGVRRQITGGTQ
jgi:hypothetical protein